MTKFASTTSVSVERTRGEIEITLQRYGATHFGYMTGPTSATVGFVCRERQIRFTLPVPDMLSDEFAYTRQKKRRSGSQQHAAWEQACRQRWRALLLAIKAKLEAVDSGIAEFEEEFLAYVVDPMSKQTVYERVRDGLANRYLGHEKSPLLLDGPRT